MFFQRKQTTIQGDSGSGMLISPTIKVADRVDIACSHSFYLRAGGNILLQGDPGTLLNLSVANSQLACNNQTFAVAPSGFEIYPDNKSAWFQVDDCWYRGSLCISLKEQKISIANFLGLSSFLYQVLPQQIPMGWPIEAIKVQAIVSRAIALFGGYLPYGDLNDVYERSIQAVEETDGLVLSSRPGVFQTFDDLFKSIVVCSFDANIAYELALQELTAEQILASLFPNLFVGVLPLAWVGKENRRKEIADYSED